MWNPLHETDSIFVAWRRPRWLCAGALGLATGLFIVGFLLGRGALATHTPAASRAVPLLAGLAGPLPRGVPGAVVCLGGR